jgi:hypothetical protein
MMVTEFSAMVSFQELFSQSTDHFLEPFKDIVDPDITNGMELPFILSEKQRDIKISPILEMAKPVDAQEIVDIYLDIYRGTYPYKEMESAKEVRKMIKDPHYEWLLFKTIKGKIAGCFTYELDFDHKRGYMRGFNIKREYHGVIDAVKAVIGSMIGVWNQYRGKICHWYCENRTAHTKSQYLSEVCGINPIAFFPNKDVFFNKVESDIMHIAYNSKSLTTYRSEEIPKIIPKVQKYFRFANKNYDLGEIKIVFSRPLLDHSRIEFLDKLMKVNVRKSQFGYETISFHLPWNSYFTFVYTPQVSNFEKTKFNVNSQEELYVFLKAFWNLMKKRKIRYAECFVSAYQPDYQWIFSKFEFAPRGYVPSWNYNKKVKRFRDAIVFNWYQKPLSAVPKLLDRGSELFDLLERDNVNIIV